MNPPVWLEKLAAVYRRLRPDAETRRRTRYFVFDLLEQNLPHAELPMSPVGTIAFGAADEQKELLKEEG